MQRIWLSVVVVSLLVACSTAPQQSSTRTGAAPRITMPHAYALPRDFPNFVDHSIDREEIPVQAMSLVGIPYRWGGNTPDSGFDCSGLVRYIVSRAANVLLPRTTAEMSTRGESIEPDEIAPGDLLFFNTMDRPHSHVGIYVGKLRFVNAPSTGGTVRLDYLTNPYWAKHFDGIRRVAPARHVLVPFDTTTYEADNRQPDPAAGTLAAPAAAPVYAAAARTESMPSRNADSGRCPCCSCHDRGRGVAHARGRQHRGRAAPYAPGLAARHGRATDLHGSPRRRSDHPRLEALLHK